MTIVTEDVIRTIVLNVASRTLRIVSPRGQLGAPVANQDVARKQRAEQHDFRGQEQPDADLAVVQAGVGPDLDGVRNLHRESGLELRREVLADPGTLYS